MSQTLFEYLKTYEWIYNTPNTDLLLENRLEQFPRSWLDLIHEVGFSGFDAILRGTNANIPESLKNFRQTTVEHLSHLSFATESNTSPMKFDLPLLRGISKKKRYEIENIVPIINGICQQYRIEQILDIGCGLGHLAQILQDQFHYKVIGIEGDQQLVNNAKISIVYHHFLTPDSDVFLREIFRLHPGRYCVIGLHACADLTLTILKLFPQFKRNLKAAIILPCCYHRIQQVFPWRDLKWCFLKVPFYRLAAQGKIPLAQSELYWDQLTRNCLFRAVLQLICVQENWKMKRKTRKSGRKIASSNDSASSLLDYWEIYINSVGTNYDLDQADDGIIVLKKKMCENSTVLMENYHVVGGVIVLQYFLRQLCENLILWELLTSLKMEFSGDCRIVRVGNDEFLSPRNYALIAIQKN